MANRKDSFFFTDEEFKSVKRFVIEIEEELDMNVTKTDLARCAFKLLLDDYRENGVSGKVVKHLRNKVGK